MHACVCVDITGTVILESRGSSSALALCVGGIFSVGLEKLFRSDSVLLLAVATAVGVVSLYFYALLVASSSEGPPRCDTVTRVVLRGGS